MDAAALKGMQAPIKARYRDEPEAAHMKRARRTILRWVSGGHGAAHGADPRTVAGLAR